jgi:hypothetical protein
VLAHDDADRLGSVPGCRKDLEIDLSQAQVPAIGQGVDGVVDARRVAVRDDRAGARRELEMAAEEVGVQVRLDDSLDRQPRDLGVTQVATDIALRVDDDGAPGRSVPYEIRGVRQTVEVVLREDQTSIVSP